MPTRFTHPVYVCLGGCYQFPDRELQDFYKAQRPPFHRSLNMVRTHTEEIHKLPDHGFRVWVGHRTPRPETDLLG